MDARSADACSSMKTDQTSRSRLFGQIALQSATIELAGQKFAPDESKAYARFTLARAWPAITAYGTNLHPGTVANSYQSMLHQVVDYDHRIRAYDPKKNDGTKEDESRVARDHIIGAVVAVDFPRTPHGGWKLGNNRDQAPAIDGVAVIHKQAERVPGILGEHLGGRHKWTVSLEMEHKILEGGFVVGNRAKATKKQEAFMADQTPPELSADGFGYVTVESAPDELLSTYSMQKRRIVNTWQGLPVSFMQGGLNGSVHFMGVGIVRYGAEREAEIQQILASDPDALADLDLETCDLAKSYFSNFNEGFASIVETLGRLK